MLANSCLHTSNSRQITTHAKFALPFLFCLFFVSLYAADETSHRSRQFRTSSMNWKVASRSSSHPSAILWSVTQITWIERVLWLVDSYQHTFANRSHVKYEFTNTKKLVKKLARIEASSICRQQFANVFADCFCAVHTYQLEFTNTSLPTLVCRVKAALQLCA